MASSSFLPNVFNYSPQNTSHIRNVLANVRAGTTYGRNARILCPGDSTTFGAGSGNTGTGLTTGDMKKYSYPSQLATLLNAAGVNAHSNSWAGSGSITTGTLVGPCVTNDARISAGSSWTAASDINSVATLGGQYLAATTSTNAFSFTPSVNVDTFIIWYLKNSLFGTIGFDINGGTQTTVNCNNGGGNAVASTTKTGTLGSNTLNMKWVSGSVVAGIGMSAYDSSKTWVDVMNAGWCGGTASMIDNSGAIAAITYIAPDLTILNIGINDWVNGTSVSAFTSSVNDIITNAKLSGDVILVTPNPTLTSYVSAATQQSYINALYKLAQSNNIPLLDLWSRFTDYSTANALGWMFADTSGHNLHPNTLGYSDVAQIISQIILGV